MTLDAEGTNFRFSAIRGNQPVTPTVALPSNGDNLDRCLANIVEGFARVKQQCPEPPVAISLVFPAASDPAAVGMAASVGTSSCLSLGAWLMRSPTMRQLNARWDQAYLLRLLGI